MFKSGHTGPLFTPVVGLVGKGWAAPSGERFIISHDVDHEDYGDLLMGRFYAGVPYASSCFELLTRGWIRVHGDGYYEVCKFESSKHLLLDLVSALHADDKVFVDVVDNGIKVIEMSAQNFIDKYQ